LNAALINNPRIHIDDEDMLIIKSRDYKFIARKESTSNSDSQKIEMKKGRKVIAEEVRKVDGAGSKHFDVIETDSSDS
jgi:hypothetical protein